MKKIILFSLLICQVSFALTVEQAKSTLSSAQMKTKSLIQLQQIPSDGTTLVCIQATATMTGHGGTDMRCLGSNGLYKIKIQSHLNIFDLGVGISTVYFKNAASSQEKKRSCYLGGKLGGSYIIGASIQGLKQQRCEMKVSSSPVIFDSGFIDGGYFYSLGAQVGAAIDIGLERATVEKIDLFGQNIEDGLLGQNGVTSL